METGFITGLAISDAKPFGPDQKNFAALTPEALRNMTLSGLRLSLFVLRCLVSMLTFTVGLAGGVQSGGLLSLTQETTTISNPARISPALLMNLLSIIFPV